MSFVSLKLGAFTSSNRFLAGICPAFWLPSLYQQQFEPFQLFCQVLLKQQWNFCLECPSYIIGHALQSDENQQHERYGRAVLQIEYEKRPHFLKCVEDLPLQ
jgi:hypothetical protein